MGNLSRNKFIFIHILFIAFLSQQASAIEFTCESMLVSLKLMHTQKPQMRSLDESAGTPQNNREAALAALRNPSKWVNGKVQFKSDLGPSEWTPEELRDYLALDESLIDPETATKRVLEISADPAQVWPGISPILSQALHDSHELWKAALKAIIAEQHEIAKKERERDPNGFGLVNWPLWVRGRAYQLHRAKDKISFAWGRDEAQLTEGLGVAQGYEILRMLARENLIRHLVYPGLDGQRHTGMDVVLDTRLLIAERPLLVPLMPLLEIYPPKLEFTYVYGMATEEVVEYHPLNLVTASWPVEYNKHVAFFAALEPGEGALRSINAGVFNFDFGVEDDPTREAEIENEILGRLNALGEEFRAYLKIEKPFTISGKWTDFGFEVQIKGLSRMNQLLFYYYVGESLKALDVRR